MTELDVDASALRLLTIKDVAAQLRLSESTIWRAVKAGDLESVPIGRSRRFTPAAVTAYVDSMVARQRKGAA